MSWPPSNLSTVYGANRAYANLTTAAMVRAGLVPAPWVASRTAGTTLNEWGGTVTMVPFGSNTVVGQRYIQANACYAIHLNGVPKDVCTKIVSALPNAFAGIQVNNQYLHRTNGKISMADAVSYCRGPDDAGTVYLIFFGW